MREGGEIIGKEKSEEEKDSKEKSSEEEENRKEKNSKEEKVILRMLPNSSPLQNAMLQRGCLFLIVDA